MSEPESLHRLGVLEERWRSDRSPRVFLQLADELRRAGRSGRAVEVLRDGLSWHPESVSGWVALGRLLLDEGDADGAIAALESALERDPAQLVASRLLTEGWIRVGDAGKASASLERARLLSLPDADYEALAAEVRGLGPAAEGAAGDAPTVAAPFDLAPLRALPEIDLARIGPGRRGWTRVAVDAEPFAALLARPPRAADRATAGVFDLAPAVASAAAPAVSDAAPSAAAEARATAAGAVVAPAPVEAVLEAEPVVGAAPPEPIFEPHSIGEEVERETAEAAPSEALAEWPRPAPGEPAVATSTLAALYLAQGHLDEAEAEYRRVLGARADDAEALAGLHAVRTRRSAPPPEPPAPAGLTARKLRRLRGLYDGLRTRRLEGQSRVS